MAIWGPTSIAADADDGVDYVTFSDRTNEGYPSGEFFEVKRDTGTNAYGLLRFQNVTIAAGATINSATLRIYRTGAGNSLDAAQSIITVYADVGANRQDALSNTHKPPSTNWTYSTASAQLASLATTGYRSITVTSIVQELVDLGGWASGDDVCFALDPTANGSDTYWSADVSDYDADTSAQLADLEIDYTEGGGGSTPKGPLGLVLHGPFSGPV